MPADKTRNIASKIGDLTESLHRTTDVLSTADRMIDHYRDMNREQEHEIARLQDDLHKLNKDKQSNYEADLIQTLRGSHKKRSYKNSSSDMSEDEHQQSTQSRRKKRSVNHSKVRFQEELPPPDSDRECYRSSLLDITKRQDMLEWEIEKDRRKRMDEIDRLDSTLHKQLAISQEDEKEKQNDVVKNNLKKIHQQIEEDHFEWKKQRDEIKVIAEEMKSLKEVVKEVTTPKPKQSITRPKYSMDDDIGNGYIEQELKAYKRRLDKEEETIFTLKEDLKAKEKENRTFESTINEIQSLSKMKSGQLKLLEEQMLKEKSERQKLLKQHEEIEKKMMMGDKEYANLLAQLSDVKAESRSNQLAYERSLQTIPELKRLLEKSERHRDKYTDQITQLESELEIKEKMMSNLSIQVNEVSSRMRLMQEDIERYSKLSEERLLQLNDTMKELKDVKGALTIAETNVKEADNARQTLKEKALNTIKEYKSKCRLYERQMQKALEIQKEKELEHSKELSHSKVLEINNFKLQKEYQETKYGADRLKQDLNECESTVSQISYENSQLQEALSHAHDESKQFTSMQKELQETRNQKITLEKQLLEEKRRRKEFESLLHESYEKALFNKEESSALQKQLVEERNNRALDIAKTREENEDSTKTKLLLLEDKITKLAGDNLSLENQLKSCKEKQELLERNCHEKDSCLNSLSQKNEDLLVKVKRFVEENKKFKRQHQLSKNEFEEKIKYLEMSLKSEKDRNSLLDDQLRGNEEYHSDVKDSMKILLSISIHDVENILNLLTEEEENPLPVKDIPPSLPPEHRKLLLELREKLETSYTIAKTLKRRFKQQKLLIKKAQEKIKIQSSVKDGIQQRYEGERNTLHEQIELLNIEKANNMKRSDEKDKKILQLENRVAELTKHLEQCTRALHKSVEVDKERRNVLQEIEHLKNERVENQKIDENYYRCSEKIDILSDQLHEAKNSLHQMKQDTMDDSAFANRMIETFGSVSPSRKRRLYSFSSPGLRSTAKSLFNTNTSVPSYLNDIQSASSKDVNAQRINNDPMSMTDDEFHDMFIPNQAVNNNLKKSVKNDALDDQKRVSYQDS